MINLLENISLKSFNTFGVEAKARFFAFISTVNELREIMQLKAEKQKLFILGGGSNVLFTQDVDGLVLINRTTGIERIDEDENSVTIKAGSGENWSDLVDFTVAQNLGGLENMSLIPGSVGAAPVQNIGAYGVEQKDSMLSLEAMNLETGLIRTFTHLECEFGYRYSIFKNHEKGKWFILNVSYRLLKYPQINLNYKPLKEYFSDKDASEISLKQISEAVKSIRRSKLPDPKVLGNGGSFFKNPIITKQDFLPMQKKFPTIPFYELPDGKIKLAAGWLIEQCGWKGRNQGQAGVHKNQALVLVNLGNAKGADILNLAKAIQADVWNKFGIKLEAEVSII